jgi:hypothetical protein
MMSFALLAFLSFAHDEFLLGMLLLVASVLVKVATLVFLPLFLIYALARHPDWRSRSIYFLSALCGAALLALVAYVPFWQGIDTVRASLAGNERYVQSFSTVLYSLGPGLSLDQATLLGRLLFVPVYAFALWLASRGFAELTRASFIAALGLLCLAVTNFKVWYGLLAVMVAALVPRLPERLSGLLFAGGASVSAAFYAYLWWWGGLQNGSSLTFADNLAFFVTFLPAAYALVYLSTSRPWRSEASTVDRPATPSGTASGVG